MDREFFLVYLLQPRAKLAATAATATTAARVMSQLDELKSKRKAVQQSKPLMVPRSSFKILTNTENQQRPQQQETRTRTLSFTQTALHEMQQPNAIASSLPLLSLSLSFFLLACALLHRFLARLTLLTTAPFCSFCWLLCHQVLYRRKHKKGVIKMTSKRRTRRTQKFTRSIEVCALFLLVILSVCAP